MENRFMDIPAFQIYAGKIGRNKAYDLARLSGARIKLGRRVVIDRIAFDKWADEQTK
ncbi:hypothetical protein [Clostridium transplantifaecale]|uniref:hypothetical protein n=1 Tax=Clostridium transplantifaecale TaxID=2479838 RepID=UPI0013DDE461|nr:hypothetical protein [Clostridium transplantifaecale]